MIDLYPFQHAAIERVENAIADGQRGVLLVSPTGSGKTQMFTELVRRAVQKGKRVLVLVNRAELLQQAAQRLYEAGIGCGLVCPDVPYQPSLSVQVAMVPTLHRRAVAGTRMNLPPADLVIIDEAHHTPAESYLAIVKEYSAAVILGVTATPARSDGRGLGAVFSFMIEAATVRELIELGFLSPLARAYAPVDASITKGVKTTAGDFNKEQLGKVMNQPKLVGDVVRDYQLHGQSRKAIVFAVDKAHSAQLCRDFLASGIMAAHLDGDTPADERKRILADLKAGRVDVVCNCMVLTEGFDCPAVSCIILARPTKSLPLYLQMLGRGMRVSSETGKRDWLLLDHSGSIYRHGFPDETIVWALHPDRKAQQPLQLARDRGEIKRLVACPECGAVRQQGAPCSACGWRPRTRAEGLATVEGDLGLVSRRRKSVAPEATEADQRRFYRELLGYAREIRLDTKQPRHQDGWAAHSYKEKFNDWPQREWAVSHESPSDATRSWIRSRQIAYAKGRRKAARAA